MANSHSRSTIMNGPGGPSSAATSHLQRSLEEVLSMSKGDAEGSYSRNSSLQKNWIATVAFPVLDDVLEHFVPPANGPIVVLDLGCASGPNSITNTSHIVDRLCSAFSKRHPAVAPPEFQCLFNDLPSNDFNNLFQLLGTPADSRVNVGGNYFAAGIPGSFYRRLVPKASIHVAFSTFSLQYISKIPDAVLDRKSPAFNEGNWWIDGSNVATVTAYKEQASLDFKCFLQARAAELIPGGILYLVVWGGSRFNVSSMSKRNKKMKIDEDPLNHGLGCLGKVWRELAAKGIITKEQIDTFNLPIYFPSIDEILEDINSYSSAYHVKVAKVVKSVPGPLERMSMERPANVPRESYCAKMVINAQKGAFGAFFEGHLGKDASEILWKHYEKAVEVDVVPHIYGNSLTYVLALLRK